MIVVFFYKAKLLRSDQNNMTNCRKIKELKIEKISRNKMKQNEITRFIELNKDETKQERNEIFDFIESS